MSTPTPWFLTFRDLSVGDRFRFLYNPYVAPRTSEQVFTKIRPRWFEDARGRKYTTGASTSVQREAA